MQRLLILVAVILLSGCLTAPPKEAAKPTLMPRAQSYKDLTHLPSPTGKIFVSVYNIQDETGQFKPYPASNFSTAVPQSATAMLVTALKDSRWFVPLERDQIAVNLRVVNVSTGEILSSVNTSKTILSYEVQAGVFRFIDYQRLLEGEIGYTSNEPVMLCLMSAIETGVIFLINDGIDRGLWDLQNKADRQNDILMKYRHMSVPPES